MDGFCRNGLLSEPSLCMANYESSRDGCLSVARREQLGNRGQDEGENLIDSPWRVK